MANNFACEIAGRFLIPPIYRWEEYKIIGIGSTRQHNIVVPSSYLPFVYGRTKLLGNSCYYVGFTTV